MKLIDQIISNQSVEVEGITFEWKGFGFGPEGLKSRYAKYLCQGCWREELKDSPDHLIDLMTSHAKMCGGKLRLVGA